MAQTRLGIGVIGCGRVAALRHLPVLARLDGARPVAVADPAPERARDLAARFGVPRRYGDHEELLADPDVDAVVVCVPAAQHVEVSAAALEAGKPVLLEKPPALELAQLDRLLEVEAAGAARVVVAFNLRWHRLVQRARALLAGGAIGEPQALTSIFTSDFGYRATAGAWRFSRRDGGGALIEMGVHHLDLWGHLLDDVVAEATGLVHSEPGEEDATIAAAGRTARGTLVSSTISQRCGQAQEVEVLGREGRIRLGLYRFDGLEVLGFHRHAGDFRSRPEGAWRTLRELPHGLRARRGGGEFADSYRREWEHFLRVVRGEEEPGCTLAEGRRTLAVLLAVAQSADTGRAVPVGAPAGAPA